MSSPSRREKTATDSETDDVEGRKLNNLLDLRHQPEDIAFPSPSRSKANKPKTISIPIYSYRQVMKRKRQLDSTELDSTMPQAPLSLFSRNITASQYRARNHKLLSQKQSRISEAIYAEDWIYGTNYIDIWFGVPSQRMTLVLSTTNAFTLFPCDNKGTESYNIESSENFIKLPCDHCTDVGESSTCDATSDQCQIRGSLINKIKSWSAYVAHDLAYVGGADVADPTGTKVALDHGFEMTFGCMDRKSNSAFFSSFTKFADGIVGFSTAPTSFCNQMFKARKLETTTFSLCFNTQKMAQNSKAQTGMLSLGGESDISTTPVVYAENVSQEGSFGVYIKNIFFRKGGGVSSKSVKDQKIVTLDMDPKELNGGGGVILDSGVPFTMINSVIETNFKREWERMSGEEYKYDGVSFTEEELKTLPTILIQLKAAQNLDFTSINDKNTIGKVGHLDPSSPDDVLIAIPATEYMSFDPKTKKYSNYFYLENNDITIIGLNSLRGKTVISDQEKNRIGFAEHCACQKEVIMEDCAIDGIVIKTSDEIDLVPPSSPLPGGTPDSNLVNQGNSSPIAAPISLGVIEDIPGQVTNLQIDTSNIDDLSSIAFVQFYIVGAAAMAVMFLALVMINGCRMKKRKREQMTNLHG